MTETEDKAPQGQPRPGRNEKTRRRRGGRRNPEGEAGKIPASEVFRASFLECLDAEDAASFASFGEALFRSVLEGAPSLPGGQPSESATHRELRAIAVDLQMTEKQLLHVSREREECDLDAADTALSTMAERYAWRVARIRADLEKTLASWARPESA